MQIKPLPSDPRYQVSSDGDVFGLRGGCIRGVVGGHGYKSTFIGSRAGGGKRKQRTFHSLVLETFVGPRPEGMEIRHLNGDKLDNRLENLCYGTQSENMHDRIRHGTHRNANVTHCPSGHEYSEDNTWVCTRRNGGKFRVCRTCNRRYVAASYRKRNRKAVA